MDVSALPGSMRSLARRRDILVSPLDTMEASNNQPEPWCEEFTLERLAKANREKKSLCRECSRIPGILNTLRLDALTSTGSEPRDEDSPDLSVTLHLSYKHKSICGSCEVVSRLLQYRKPQVSTIRFSAVSATSLQRGLAAHIEGISLYIFPSDGPSSVISGKGSIPKHDLDVMQKLQLDDETSHRVFLAALSLWHCETDHQMTCRSAQGPDRPVPKFPIYLMDLERLCLVRSSTQEQYAALSYVWGSGKWDKTYKPWECFADNLPRMQESQFFGPSSQLPATIADAMKFARLMGVRYLWIDRYCIAQDNDAEKHVQIQSMGVIYRHARFTIIAADGNVTHGLRFFQKPSHSDICGNSKPLPGGIGRICACFEPITSNTRWATRGWTFQEEALATRCFIFRGSTVIFRCQRCVWHEGITVPIDLTNTSYGSEATSLIIHRWPNMLYFKRLLESYVGRNLTYLMDSLNAFTGITKELEASFPAGFLFGLPEVCFDVALLWQSNGALHDRLESIDAVHMDSIPSWSWARWTGNLDFTAWEAAGECLFLSYYQQNFCIITKTVAWSKELRPSGLIVPIADTLAKHREYAKHKSLSPPAGWKRMPTPRGLGVDSTLSRLLESSNCRFTHQSLGDSVSFRFPVPLPADESDKRIQPKDEHWNQTIHGCVKSVTLQVVRKCSTFEDETHYFGIMSSKVAGTQIGVIQIHDVAIAEKVNQGDDVFVELIELSAGEFLALPGRSVGIPWSFLSEWELKIRTGNGNVYRFYNVMMITRRDGYAERRGLGRVEKTFWEELEVDEVDIVLA